MSRVVATTLLAEALHLEPGDVEANSAIGVAPGWDSLAHTRLVLALEAHLGRDLAPDEVVAIGSLADVVALLEQQR